jgi:Zn ribbon nucleic-acid-binding protein
MTCKNINCTNDTFTIIDVDGYTIVECSKCGLINESYPSSTVNEDEDDVDEKEYTNEKTSLFNYLERNNWR